MHSIFCYAYLLLSVTYSAIFILLFAVYVCICFQFRISILYIILWTYKCLNYFRIVPRCKSLYCMALSCGKLSTRYGHYKVNSSSAISGLNCCLWVRKLRTSFSNLLSSAPETTFPAWLTTPVRLVAVCSTRKLVSIYQCSRLYSIMNIHHNKLK